MQPWVKRYKENGGHHWSGRVITWGTMVVLDNRTCELCGCGFDNERDFDPDICDRNNPVTISWDSFEEKP